MLCSQDVGGILEKLILPELSVAALQLLVKVFGGEIMLQFQFPQVECGPGGRVFSSFMSSKGSRFFSNCTGQPVPWELSSTLKPFVS